MRKILNTLIVKQILLALCIALIPLVASAAGLGKLYVFSSLGEPLNAEIELLSVSPEAMTTLTAGLASQEQYLAQGIDKTPIQQSIKADIAKRPDGTLVVQLTSVQAVTDPFLDMLIQVVWSDGQLSREYTLLLDPSDSSATNVAEPIAETPKSISTSSAARELLAAVKQPVSKSNLSNSVGQARSEKTIETPLQAQAITTVKGDTLSALLGQIKVQDVNLDQLLLGVYRANPSAFADGNMNRLKVGKIINIPSVEILQAISKSEAREEVNAQVANWHAYATKLADAATHADETENSASQLTRGKIIAKAEDKAAPASEGSRDVVKLTKTETEKSKVSDLNPQHGAYDSAKTVANIQDDIAAKENENKDADEKSAFLQKQISDMKKLLTLRSKGLADAQNNAEQVPSNHNEFPNNLSDIDPVVLAVSGAIITFVLALIWLNRRKHKRALSGNESVNLDDKTFSEPLAENSTDSIGFVNNSSSSGQAIVDANETGLVIEANALVADGTQAVGDISPPDIASSYASEAELDASANKPLEMDLTSISLDFESAPQLTVADIQAAPIPDAFNGDFSNLLKINVKPKSDKVSQPSTISKSVAKPIRSSKTKINTSNLEESSEVATKLELAAAYIDMEDKKGALALLREAINEGGPEQRARAQDLIDRLT